MTKYEHFLQLSPPPLIPLFLHEVQWPTFAADISEYCRRESFKKKFYLYGVHIIEKNLIIKCWALRIISLQRSLETSVHKLMQRTHPLAKLRSFTSHSLCQLRNGNKIVTNLNLITFL